LNKSVTSTGIKIPPLIFETGGGQQGNFRADVKVLPDPDTTTIQCSSLHIAIESKQISKSPPHSDCKMCIFLSPIEPL